MSFNRPTTEEDKIILKRAAREMKEGWTANLGIGLPSLLPVYLPAGMDIQFHSENGVVGLGQPLDDGTPYHDVIDAGGRAYTLATGAACFDSAMSFALVRSGKLDMVVLGSFEVSLRGDLANWMIPGKLTPGMGGGMEVAQKARRVMVVSRHQNKYGVPKLVADCTLPLTAPECVDILVTERAVFRRKDKDLLTLTSVHPAYTVEEIRGGFDFNLPVASEMEDWPDE